MKKFEKRRKYLSLIIALLMVFSCVPSMVFGEQVSSTDIIDSGTCGENVNWLLDSEGTLIISGNGEMDNYSYSSYSLSKAPWDDYKDSIREVRFSDGITNVGKYSFYNCNEITKVILPNSLSQISEGAFKGCSNLSQIRIPFGVEIIGYSAFYNCDALTSVSIPDSVVSIENSAFSCCSELTDVVLSSNLTILNACVFCECRKLKNIVLPDKLKEIGELTFGYSGDFESITIPESLTTISNKAFYYSNVKFVFYKGTKESWKNVSIGTENKGLLSSYVHFSSTDHLWEENYSIDQNSTCTNVGSESIHCSFCNAKKDTREIAANGHSWCENAEIIEPPTCTREGSKGFRCITCNAIDDSRVEILPPQHTWGDPVLDWRGEGKYYKCYGYYECRTCSICYAEKEDFVKGEPCEYICTIKSNGIVYEPRCTICNGCYFNYEDLSPDGNEYNEFLKYSADANTYCKVVISIPNTTYTANGKIHRPKASVYLYAYWNDDVYIGKIKMPDEYYDISYSGNGVKAGTYKVNISFKGLYKGTVAKSYTVKSSPMVKTTLDLYKGKSYNLKRSDATGTIKWKSSNKKVATVSSKGKVVAKGYGTCKITGKYRGKTYTCKVKIPHHLPNISRFLSYYDTRNNIVSVYIKNKGKATLTVYSSGSKLIDTDYKVYDRTLKLTGGKKYITIKPGKAKYVKYKVVGKNTWPGIEDKKIRIKLKYDGKKYTRYAY